jgi:DNA-binding response OmpR family regulator
VPLPAAEDTREVLSGHQHARGSILVVDDEPTIAEVVARYLQRAGYATRVAGDGALALALASEERPDLVVLDLMLPGTDGHELMRRLRAKIESDPTRPTSVQTVWGVGYRFQP